MADRYLQWGLVGAIAVIAIVFAVVGLRRRIARGRPARFHFGFGAGLVDVIEGLSGRELSPRAQGFVFGVSIAIGIAALAVGIAVLLMGRDAAS
jgi:hypothetical protein